MTAADSETLFVAWITEGDEMARAAAVMLQASPCGLEVGLKILSAGFAAGYVIAERNRITAENAHVLAQYDGTVQ